LGVATNADPDADGLTNLREFQLGTNPTRADTDGDGMPDGWEVANSLNPCVNDAALDADNDGLANLQEYLRGANPRHAYSDADVLADGEEVNIFGLSPASSDSNQNGLPDAFAKTTRRGWETSARIIDHNTHTFTPSGDFLIWPDSAVCSLFYDLQTDVAGLHLLEISAANWAAVTIPNYSFAFAIYANGIDVGTITIPARANYGVATNHIILPWLAPASYNVHLVWLNRYAWDGVIDRPAIQRVRLLAIDNTTDANLDGIADWMVPVLQASSADTDHDGLLDRDEVLTYQGNPLLTDTDNDGLADAYEALTSHTALNSADTDGDGVSDAAELQLTGTDPLTVDFTNGWQTVAARMGKDYTAVAGDWRCDSTNAVAFGRGWVEYAFVLPASETCVLRVNAMHEWWGATGAVVTPLTTSDLLLSVDGQFVGRYTLRSTPGTPGELHAILPNLPAGNHTVRLFWNAIDPRLHLRMQQVVWGSFGGFDVDHDGVTDWMAAAIRRVSGVDRASAASVVSPACIEGYARYPLLTSATSATNAVTVLPGVAGRWYADLPLDPTGAATPLSVRFEHGAVATNLLVAWTALDLLAASNQTLRLGDTLMFTVLPPPGCSNGTAVITLDNGNPFSFTPGQSFTQCFTVATNHVLQATWTPESGPAITRTINVAVLAAPLPSAPACMLGRTRTWTCTNVTAGVILQTDSDTPLTWDGTNATLTVYRMYAEHVVVARAGAHGPILTFRRINPFWVQAAVDSYVKVVETRATSQVWADRMVSLGIPGDVRVEIAIFVAGVTFDDLSVVRNLTAATIGEAGDYTFLLIHPNSVAASVCHTIRCYQGGVYLGEAFYAQIGLPEDLR
jgi:hypothetical protein